MSDFAKPSILKEIEPQEIQGVTDSIMLQNNLLDNEGKQLFDIYLQFRNSVFEFILSSDEGADVDFERVSWLSQELKELGIFHDLYAENIKQALSTFQACQNNQEYLWDALKGVDKLTRPQARNDGWHYKDKFLAGLLALFLNHQKTPRRSAVYIASKMFGLSEGSVEPFFKKIYAYFTRDETPEKAALSKILLGVMYIRIEELETDLEGIKPRANQERSRNELQKHLDTYKNLRWAIGWGYYDSLKEEIRNPAPFIKATSIPEQFKHLDTLSREKFYVNESTIGALLMYDGTKTLFPALLQIDMSEYANSDIKKLDN